MIELNCVIWGKVITLYKAKNKVLTIFISGTQNYAIYSFKLLTIMFIIFQNISSSMEWFQAPQCQMLHEIQEKTPTRSNDRIGNATSLRVIATKLDFLCILPL